MNKRKLEVTINQNAYDRLIELCGDNYFSKSMVIQSLILNKQAWENLNLIKCRGCENLVLKTLYCHHCGHPLYKDIL